MFFKFNYLHITTKHVMTAWKQQHTPGGLLEHAQSSYSYHYFKGRLNTQSEKILDRHIISCCSPIILLSYQLLKPYLG
jgi:hypothetical protein